MQFWFGRVNYEQKSPQIGDFKLDRMRHLLTCSAIRSAGCASSTSPAARGKARPRRCSASILQEAGYRVGLFTSPHLVDVEERIQVDRQPIAHARTGCLDGRDPRRGSAGARARADVLRDRHRAWLPALRRAGASISRSSRSAWAGASIRPTCASRCSRSSPASVSITRKCSATRWPRSRSRRPASSSRAGRRSAACACRKPAQSSNDICRGSAVRR